MLKINSPLLVKIELVMIGTYKEIDLFRIDLMRYVLYFSCLSTSKDEYSNYEMSFVVSLSDINKVNKIIEKHTQYFTNIKNIKIIKES